MLKQSSRAEPRDRQAMPKDSRAVSGTSRRRQAKTGNQPGVGHGLHTEGQEWKEYTENTLIRFRK